MNRREYFMRLSSSPAGLVGAAISLGIGLALCLSVDIVVGIVAGAASLAAFVVIATLTGFGPRAAAAESNRREWAEAQRLLELAKANRDALASIRVRDQDIKTLLELAASRGTAYLAASLEAKSRDPLAEEALADCVSIADLYLKELDGASTEKRYGLADADPFADAKTRASAALRDRAAVIDKAAFGLSGGLSPADRMEIKESI